MLIDDNILVKGLFLEWYAVQLCYRFAVDIDCCYQRSIIKAHFRQRFYDADIAWRTISYIW